MSSGSSALSELRLTLGWGSGSSPVEPLGS